MKRTVARRSITTPLPTPTEVGPKEELACGASASAAARRISADHLRKRCNKLGEEASGEAGEAEGSARVASQAGPPSRDISIPSCQTSVPVPSSPAHELSVKRLSLDDDDKKSKHGQLRQAAEWQGAARSALSAQPASTSSALFVHPPPFQPPPRPPVLPAQPPAQPPAQSVQPTPVPSASCNNVRHRRPDGHGCETEPAEAACGSCGILSAIAATPVACTAATPVACTAATATPLGGASAPVAIASAVPLSRTVRAPMPVASAVPLTSILSAPPFSGNTVVLHRISRRAVEVNGWGSDSAQLRIDVSGNGSPLVPVPFVQIDTTGDGCIDALLADADGDGRADVLVLDTSSDGIPDTAISCQCFDTTGDARADVLLVDTTDDGHADTIIRIFAVRESAPPPSTVPGFWQQAPSMAVPYACEGGTLTAAVAPMAAIAARATSTTLHPNQDAHRAASVPPINSGPGASSTRATYVAPPTANHPLLAGEDLFSLLRVPGDAPRELQSACSAGSSQDGDVADAASLLPLPHPQISATLLATIPPYHGQGAADFARGGKGAKADGALFKQGWTPQEDETIVRMVQLTGQKWSFIAGALPGRTDDAVRNRYLRLQKKKSSNPSERSAVTSADLVECHSTKKGDMWTPEEDALILEGVRIHGYKWQLIAGELPGRSANAVRNRYLRCTPQALAAGGAGACGATGMLAEGCAAGSYACYELAGGGGAVGSDMDRHMHAASEQGRANNSSSSANANSVAASPGLDPGSSVAELSMFSATDELVGGFPTMWDAAALCGEALQSIHDDIMAPPNGQEQ